MGKPRGLPGSKEGGIQIINFTTPFSCFFKKEPTLPQMAVSVGSGSVVLRAVALVETAFLKHLFANSIRQCKQ